MKIYRIALSVPLFLLCMSGTIVSAEDIDVEPSVEPLIQGMDDSLQRIIDLHGKATVESSRPVLKHSKVNAGKFAGKLLTQRQEIEWFSINEKYRFSQQIQNFIDGKLIEDPVAYAGPQLESVGGQFNENDNEADLVLSRAVNVLSFLVLSATETN